MLIKQIYLDGFRQFYPPQTLSFSTNPNKKVTLVLAESGVGKTTIIQAFKWAFYGGAKYQNVLNEELKSNLRPDEYKIVEVGCEVQKNLKNLGHICLRFNNNEEGESLEGSLYLEDKDVQIPEIGTEIAIFKA